MLGTLALVALVMIVAGVALFFHTRALVDRNGAACPACDPFQAQGPMNVLVLGSDSRAVLDPQDLQHYDPNATDRNSGQRADSVVLLHIDPTAAKAVALALPRDLRVPAPRGGYQKINGFYNQGISAMVKAVHDFTGLPVNHYVEVNFNSFRTITNALGGVNVRFTRKVLDTDSGLNQPAGCNLLTGDQALAFVRVRHIDSDYGRIARQQLFVKLMMEKVLSAGTLLNPQKVVSLINLGAGNVGHDSGLGLSTMSSMALRFRHFSSTDLDFRVVPSLPQPDGYVVANTAQSTALFTAMRTGHPLPDYGKQGVSAVDASNVAATILNGTKLAGVAAQARTSLEAKGYTVVKTGNADRSDYAATVVYYTAGNQQKAQFLATQLFGGAQVQPVPAALNVTAGDAVVVLGKDYSPNAVAPKSPGSTNPLLPAGPAVVEPAAQPWFSAC
ncbi:MAG: Cell envelope-associated transcriptional attenuator LytR-CpsA-Psr, subfamily [Actinobacteria bacterium]|nr:Cell envelope-associated transcriptional attenuator LytR-CpsA-Psr, subfamily [Actinomycetota bacterium]